MMLYMSSIRDVMGILALFLIFKNIGLTLSLSSGSHTIRSPQQLLFCLIIASAVWKRHISLHRGNLLKIRDCKVKRHLLGAQHVADKHVAEEHIFKVAACSLRLLQPDLR